jgi:uncharacterized protein
VKISFDPAKNERNIRERELNFERAAEFDFTTATIDQVYRNGENPWLAIGYLDKRLHKLCFIPTVEGIRVISFRKTNEREANLYDRPQRLD